MDQLKKNILAQYGDQGQNWISSLAHRVEELAKQYGLTDLVPVKDLSYNYVLAGRQADVPVILKLGIDHNALKQEAAALHAFSGFGTPKIMIELPGALILQCAVPGRSLKAYFPTKDAESVRIACDVMNRLHLAPIPTQKFPHLRDWLSALDKTCDIPDSLLKKSRKLRDELLESEQAPVLLHGDLHHYNILQHGNDFIAIDPKGVIGERAFEATVFIRNPIPEFLDHENAVNILQRRIHDFSCILQLNPERLKNWCYVEAVLSWIWDLEDNMDFNYFKKLALIYDGL